MYLNCHSYYSLRYGTLSPEDLVKQALGLKTKTLVLTDINNSSAIFEFVKSCKENQIKPIVGIEFRKNNQYLYTGIAKNNEGFKELNSFLTEYNLAKEQLVITSYSIHYTKLYDVY